MESSARKLFVPQGQQNSRAAEKNRGKINRIRGDERKSFTRLRGLYVQRCSFRFTVGETPYYEHEVTALSLRSLILPATTDARAVSLPASVGGYVPRICATIHGTSSWKRGGGKRTRNRRAASSTNRCVCSVVLFARHEEEGISRSPSPTPRFFFAALKQRSKTQSARVHRLCIHRRMVDVINHAAKRRMGSKYEMNECPVSSARSRGELRSPSLPHIHTTLNFDSTSSPAASTHPGGRTIGRSSLSKHT